MPRPTPEEQEDIEEAAAERYSKERFMPVWAGFMAASMASGNAPTRAAGQADLALVELKKRYPQ